MFDNIVCSINNKMKKILTKLSTNESKLDSIGTDVTSVQTTSNEIKSLIANNSSSVIKSIQRGVCLSGSNYYEKYTVDINTVDVNKTIILLDGYAGSAGSKGDVARTTYIYDFTSTMFVLHIDQANVMVSYQVIEFY